MIARLVIALVLMILCAPPLSSMASPSETITCFKTGEELSGSAFKLCFYDCRGTPVQIVAGRYAYCPYTIRVRP